MHAAWQASSEVAAAAPRPGAGAGIADVSAKSATAGCFAVATTTKHSHAIQQRAIGSRSAERGAAGANVTTSNMASRTRSGFDWTLFCFTD
eukprot:6195489-Prymnesium_polylepis.2